MKFKIYLDISCLFSGLIVLVRHIFQYNLKSFKDLFERKRKRETQRECEQEEEGERI